MASCFVHTPSNRKRAQRVRKLIARSLAWLRLRSLQRRCGCTQGGELRRQLIAPVSQLQRPISQHMCGQTCCGAARTLAPPSGSFSVGLLSIASKRSIVAVISLMRAACFAAAAAATEVDAGVEPLGTSCAPGVRAIAFVIRLLWSEPRHASAGKKHRQSVNRGAAGMSRTCASSAPATAAAAAAGCRHATASTAARLPTATAAGRR